MSVFYEVMLEELDRNLRKQEAFRKELALHPKGYLSVCHIDGKPYVYRKWREEGKVCSLYIGVNGDEAVKAAEKERAAYLLAQKSLKALKAEEASLRRAIKSYGSAH